MIQILMQKTNKKNQFKTNKILINKIKNNSKIIIKKFFNNKIIAQ